MKHIFKIILVVHFLFLSSSIFSCGGAFQRKLFPIGEKNDTLLFREISMSRLPQGDTFSVHTRMLFFNTELKLVRAVKTDSTGYNLVDFYKNEAEYLEQLIYQGTQVKVSFLPEKYAYGDYLDSTSFAEVKWELDSLVNRVMFKFDSDEWNEILFYPTGEKSMFENYPKPENCPESLLTRDPYLGTICIYNVGIKRLVILHLCNSDQLGDPEMDWKHHEIPFRKFDKKTDIKIDRMASHSYGTDVLFWLN